MSQPTPKPNNHPAIWPIVIDEMKKRDQLGRQRYGTPLQPFNGRDSLMDAYEEVLDLAVYIRTAIYELDDYQMTKIEQLNIAAQAVKLYAETHPRPPHVTQAQAAEMLRVSRNTMSKIVKAGVIRLNSCGLIPITEVDRVLATDRAA